jgi:hypothetical protein
MSVRIVLRFDSALQPAQEPAMQLSALIRPTKFKLLVTCAVFVAMCCAHELDGYYMRYAGDRFVPGLSNVVAGRIAQAIREKIGLMAAFKISAFCLIEEAVIFLFCSYTVACFTEILATRKRPRIS